MHGVLKRLPTTLIATRIDRGQQVGQLEIGPHRRNVDGRCLDLAFVSNFKILAQLSDCQAFGSHHADKFEIQETVWLNLYAARGQVALLDVFVGQRPQSPVHRPRPIDTDWLASCVIASS